MAEQIIHTNEEKEIIISNPDNLDLFIKQERNSTLRIFFFDYNHTCGECFHSLKVEQQGEGCLTEIYLLSFLRGNYQQHCDSHIIHKVSNGTSKQIVRYVLTEQAKGDFAGNVILLPNAQQIDAQQNNNNLILSDQAIMRTRPCLEIYADDVKASHGAAIGQLDENALFYMQQRGLSYNEARDMLIMSFMSECILPLKDDRQKEELMLTLDSILKNAQ